MRCSVFQTGFAVGQYHRLLYWRREKSWRFIAVDAARMTKFSFLQGYPMTIARKVLYAHNISTVVVPTDVYG